MINFNPGSHISRLITFLALVGEYPLNSLELLGNRREIARLIDKLKDKQTIRNPATDERITHRILLIRGKGDSRSVRLSRFAFPLLDWLGVRDFYISRFGDAPLAGDLAHIERNHRVAEAAAMLLRAGIECRPWMLPQLQMSKRALITDHTMAFFARDLKQIIPGSLNKTKYARYTAALFMPGSCLPIYNTRNSAMKWYGEGERKVREDLTHVARANSGCPAVDSAILLGRNYDTALTTIQSTASDNHGLLRFDRIYPRVFYIPFGDFGIRQLAFFQVPDWREKLLSTYFDDDVRSYDRGAFEYDAFVDGKYVLSFLDGDIARLIRFRDALRNNRAKTNGFIDTVIAKFIPRVLDSQSLAVDAITGATATSNGVRQGIENALKDAGMDLAGLYTPIEKKTASETYETDVLVVGMGSSGTTAALAAAEKGVKVLAIDKAGKWGGTGATTSGPANINAPSQVAAEIVDWKDPIQGQHTKAPGEPLVDADALYETWLDYTTIDGVQGAKPELIAKVIYESGETCDWLQDYGFAFGPAVGFVGGKWAIFSSYVGNKALTESYFAAAYDKYVQMGGEYLLETEATDLLFEDGKCVGVKAVKADGTDVTIRAKAVLCCSGGYAGSEELQRRFTGDAYKLYGMYTNDGKMIASAVDNGAATYSIGIYPMSHFVAPSQITTCFSFADNDIPYGLICTAEGMAVNREGNRFINESSIAMEAFYQGSEFFYVYSSDQIDVLREKGLSANASGRYLSQGGIVADTPLTNIDAVIDYGVDAGFIYKAATLDELAAQLGVPAENLKASVAGYKPDGDAFGKPAEKFERLGVIAPDAAYYVAFTGCPYIYSTCGGLDVNENFQVLDTEGNVMPGLFACGTDSMGVLFNENKAYTNYGGCAQGYCFVSGRDAGAFAAEQILAG